MVTCVAQRCTSPLSSCPDFTVVLGMVPSIRRQRPTHVLFALCADTLVALYFGWQNTIALAQTGTPGSMVSFAGFAFWPPLSSVSGLLDMEFLNG